MFDIFVRRQSFPRVVEDKQVMTACHSSLALSNSLGYKSSS